MLVVCCTAPPLAVTVIVQVEFGKGVLLLPQATCIPRAHVDDAIKALLLFRLPVGLGELREESGSILAREKPVA